MSEDLPPSRRDSLLDTLKRYRSDGIGTDLIINARGTRFSAHRVILIAGSDFLENLLILSSEKEIKLDVDPKTFKSVLDIIYGDPYRHQKESFTLEQSLVFLQVRNLNFEEMALLPFTSDEFDGYFKLVDMIYPEDVPQNVLDHITTHIVVTPYRKNRIMVPALDLRNMTDEFLMLVLNYKLHVPNLLDFYEVIKGLVEEGYSPKLLTLINYNLFPPQFKGLFPRDFLEKYQKNGPIPQLDGTKVIIIQAPEDQSQSFQIMRADGKIDTVYLNDRYGSGPIRVGDIGNAYGAVYNQSRLTLTWILDTP